MHLSGSSWLGFLWLSLLTSLCDHFVPFLASCCVICVMSRVSLFGGQFEPLCGCLCFFCHCVSFFVHFECLRNDFPRVRGHLETLSSYFTSHSEHFAALNVFWLFWVFWMTLTFHSESKRRFERRKTLKFALWCHIKQHDPVSSAHPYQGRVQTQSSDSDAHFSHVFRILWKYQHHLQAVSLRWI